MALIPPFASCDADSGSDDEMSTASHGTPTQPPAPITKTKDRLQVLLACGPLAALEYVGWHELAALRWEGYSRISNTISELHFTGTPTKPSRSLAGMGRQRAARRVRDWYLAIGSGQPFAPSDRRTHDPARCHDAAVDDLRRGKPCCARGFLVGILGWLAAMGFGAAALGRRFRIYSLVSIATVVTSFARWAFHMYRRPTQGNRCPSSGSRSASASTPTSCG